MSVLGSYTSTVSTEKEKFCTRSKIQICRLCLLEISDEGGLLDGLKSDMLSIVLPEVNLTVCKLPVVCVTCNEVLEQSYHFKSSCVENEDKIRSYCSDTNQKNNIDLEDVISFQELAKEGFCKTIMATERICRTCLMVLDEKSCTNIMADDPLMDMMKKCVPEIDLKLSQDPLICTTCLEQLENQFHFRMQCLDSEEKINYFKEKQKFSGEINLEIVYLFFLNVQDINYDKDNYQNFNVDNKYLSDIDKECKDNKTASPSSNIKTYRRRKSTRKCLGKRSKSPKLDNVAEILKTELDEKKDGDYKEQAKQNEPEIVVGKFETDNSLEDKLFCTLDEDIPEDNLLEIKKVVKVQNNTLKKQNTNKIPDNRVQSIPDYKEYSDSDTEEAPKTKKRSFVCSVCSKVFKLKGTLANHKRWYCKTSKLYKCRYCKSRFDSKDALKMHVDTHRIHCCSKCSMSFIKKGNLFKHIASHDKEKVHDDKVSSLKKDSSEKFKINSVQSEVREKTQKSPKQVEENCNYGKTKSFIFSNRTLKMFKCTLCSYQTRKKDNFLRHSKIHKTSCEVNVYKCQVCSFKTIRKELLYAHLKVHSNDDLDCRKCFLCPFKTKKEDLFKKHMAEHKT